MARWVFRCFCRESIVGEVRDYIKNQEEHHSKKGFQQEYDEFITKYGFDDA